MTIKAKFNVAAGQFQNVKIEFTAADPHALLLEMNAFTDSFKQQLGEFHAELESHISVARHEMFEGIRKNAVETLQSLGATVVGEIPVSTGEEMPGDVAHSAAVARPWQRKPAEAKPKAWEKPAKPAALDDF